jgi:hypothetical protein
MQLADIILSKISQVQKDKDHMFSHMWKIDPKDKHTQKQTWSYTNLYVEHVYNNGITLWKSGEEGKEREW